jgi:hypothetical protein
MGGGAPLLSHQASLGRWDPLLPGLRRGGASLLSHQASLGRWGPLLPGLRGSDPQGSRPVADYRTLPDTMLVDL